MADNVEIADSLRLAVSESGSLDLLAYESLCAFTPRGDFAFPSISAGPSLVKAAFDPLNPLSGFAPQQGSIASDLGAVLLHDDDPALAHIYAAIGSIIDGSSGSLRSGTGPLAPL